ncbi:MAG: hypothetical protein KAT04_02510 [Methylococcales bacterium]|nr:hypothetical protein [Methylococcales bacterium]
MNKTYRTKKTYRLLAKKQLVLPFPFYFGYIQFKSAQENKPLITKGFYKKVGAEK